MKKIQSIVLAVLGVMLWVIPVMAEETDVIIVGAGGAGLSAAIEAVDAGARVIVLEKMPVVGGNTNYATGGINAAGTPQQEAKGIKDSQKLFFDDTMKGGHSLNNPELVEVLTSNAKDTVAWLVGLGADLSDVGRLGGHSVNRSHRPAGGGAVGKEIVTTLRNAAKDRSIDIRTRTTVIRIIQDPAGNVTGVGIKNRSGKELEISAKAVVLTCGGFGASKDKVSNYRPEFAQFGTTNHPGATGDGIDLSRPLGVQFVDLDQIQTHPTVVPGKGIMITEAVRGNGAILVNRAGKRFVDEMTTRDVVSNAIIAQQDSTSYLFFDQGVRESLKAIEGYVRLKLMTEGATLKDLAGGIGIDAANLEDTVARYNEAVATGKDSAFNRSTMPRRLDRPVYYAIEVSPAVHHTMGGIKINAHAEVIGRQNKPVAGLYAAGEATGGVHGANRLGGNALADITVFGRIAGKKAAAYAATVNTGAYSFGAEMIAAQ
ncbi:MAG: flavocytochrome c [Deltaproteobacteria bacterium]|nr:flavocytochrome c [Deltaproteobacteria bacterium]